jgi:sirohydrochlorin cobaltochelatase
VTSVLIVAHGDPNDPRSSAPARAVAQALRALDRFDCVEAAALRESPSPAAVLARMPPGTWVVPFFMAQGWFVGNVVPQELAQAGVHHRLTPAVGTSGLIVEAILERASLAEHRRHETALALLAHGTPRSDSSRRTTLDAVCALGTAGYAEVTAVFTDDRPRLSELGDRTTARHVLAVPFFAGDGFHPSALGDAVALAPGRRLDIARPVGTSPRMLDAVLDVLEIASAACPSP